MNARTVEIDPRSGFCFGVVRAIEMAEKCLTGGSELVSLGDIVHNEAEVARLERLGLRTVDEHIDIATFAAETGSGTGRTGRMGGAAPIEKKRLVSSSAGPEQRRSKHSPVVLIRAHGEPPATFEAARRAGVTLIDATCPVVAALQRTVAQAFSAMNAVGGQVVIFGRRGHAEVRGLVGQASGDAIVVEDFNDLAEVDFARPVYFLAQTTSSLEKFRALADEIRRRAELCTTVTPSEQRNGDEGSHPAVHLIVKDTICRQVADREAAIGDFARRHDVVIFVAGEKSSNGRVLFDAVRRANLQSHKVQSINDLRDEWFAVGGVSDTLSGDLSIGVCGATSTPRWLMEEVAEKLKIQC